MRITDPSSPAPEEPAASPETAYGVRRGADIGAVISPAPMMWMALGEAIEFMQFVLVAVGAVELAAMRTRLPLPPFPRFRG